MLKVSHVKTSGNQEGGEMVYFNAEISLDTLFVVVVIVIVGIFFLGRQCLVAWRGDPEGVKRRREEKALHRKGRSTQRGRVMPAREREGLAGMAAYGLRAACTFFAAVVVVGVSAIVVGGLVAGIVDARYEDPDFDATQVTLRLEPSAPGIPCHARLR